MFLLVPALPGNPGQRAIKRLMLLLGRIYVRSTATILTDRVAWSVGLSIAPSIGLSVCHTSEPCKNSCTDRAAVWVQPSGLGWARGTMY